MAWGTWSQSTPNVTGSGALRASHTARGNLAREESSVLPKVSMTRMAGIRKGDIARESDFEGKRRRAASAKTASEKETIFVLRSMFKSYPPRNRHLAMLSSSKHRRRSAKFAQIRFGGHSKGITCLIPLDK